MSNPFDALMDSNNDSETSIDNIDEGDPFPDTISTPYFGEEEGLSPIGIHNENNSCFLNSVVQALVACKSFRHLLAGRAMKCHKSNEVDGNMPNMSAMQQFVRDMMSIPYVPDVEDLDKETEIESEKETDKDIENEFTFVSANSKRKSSNSKRKNKNKNKNKNKTSFPLSQESQFHPLYIQQLLSRFYQYNETNGRFCFGDQQDAQEFLQYLLDSIHQETIFSSHSNSPNAKQQNEEWENVSKLHKKQIVRSNLKFENSLTSHIFGGRLEIVIRKKKEKNSITFEPFFSISLSLQSPSRPLTTVQECLSEFFASQKLQGVRNASHKLVSASKSVSIEHLGDIAILHLKRFVYHRVHQTPEKVTSFIEYPETLLIPQSGSLSEYTLKAVIVHHGESSLRGHYTTVCCYAGNWFHVDDQDVHRVSKRFALDQQAYVLLYELK